MPWVVVVVVVGCDCENANERRGKSKRHAHRNASQTLVGMLMMMIWNDNNKKKRRSFSSIRHKTTNTHVIHLWSHFYVGKRAHVVRSPSRSIDYYLEASSVEHVARGILERPTNLWITLRVVMIYCDSIILFLPQGNSVSLDVT